jgi:arylsulfatase A-like enzyme
VDGIDISPLLLYGIDLPERPVFWKYRDQTAIRMNKYKLLVDRDSTYLFDLAMDQRETSNLADQQPELVDTLSKILDDWCTAMDSIPQKTL